MLGRHFNGVKAHPGLCWDLDSKKIIDRPEGAGNILVLQEHPDENLSRPGRTCSCQIVAGISRVDQMTRKFPLALLDTLVESCLDYGREGGMGPDEVKVVVFDNKNGDAEGSEYRLRVLKYGQQKNPHEIRLSLQNLDAVKERIIQGEPLVSLLPAQPVAENVPVAP